MSANADLAVNLQQQLEHYTGIERFVVAYSGGMDSCVLLHLLSSIQQNFAAKVVAWHINHGLSVQANSWQEQCQLNCEQLSVDFVAFPVTISMQQLKKQGLEAAARDARYSIFEKHLQATDLLLLAHHQDDYLETFLLRLLRGSGLQGLSAMPTSRTVGIARLHRPLIQFDRSRLSAYAQFNNLSWIEDPSNQDTNIDRNYLRHKVVPLLKNKWPQINRTVMHTSKVCEDAHLELEMHAQDTLHDFFDGDKLCIDSLLAMSTTGQYYLLRAWLLHLTLPLPGYKQLDNLITQLSSTDNDTKLCVSWPDVQLRRYRNYLYANITESNIDSSVYTWDLKKPLVIKAGTYTAQPVIGRGILLNGNVEVSFSSGTISGHETYKKVMQSKHIPPWKRGQLPLVFINKKLVAIADIWVRDSYIAKDNEHGWYLRWSPAVN